MLIVDSVDVEILDVPRKHSSWSAHIKVRFVVSGDYADVPVVPILETHEVPLTLRKVEWGYVGQRLEPLV